jgi:tellurite methyltransferase
MTVPRQILAFHRDQQGDWVALLDCGHRRHIRHRPPLSSFPWVEQAEGRAEHVGKAIECGRCRTREWPEGFEQYKVTSIFDRDTVPAGLLGDHQTKAGVWGRVEVLEGALSLRFLAPLDELVELHAGDLAPIPPQLSHRVELSGPVRFRVQFHRRAS